MTVTPCHVPGTPGRPITESLESRDATGGERVRAEQVAAEVLVVHVEYYNLESGRKLGSRSRCANAKINPSRPRY